MTTINIIDALLANQNNIEQMGRFGACENVLSKFGDRAELICGTTSSGFSYLYIYGEPLRDANGITEVAACVIKNSEGEMVYLYPIEF